MFSKIKNFTFSSNFEKLYTTIKLNKKLGVIGVPFDKGQKKIGVDEAPELLRKSGLINELRNIQKFNEINDYGDIVYNPEDMINIQCLDNMLNYRDFIGISKTLSEKVQKSLKENDQTLVLGGDHSIGFGSVTGHLAYDPNITLIWIDAHADLNLNTSSTSGNIHGMPVAMLLEELKNHWNEAHLKKLIKN